MGEEEGGAGRFLPPRRRLGTGMFMLSSMLSLFPSVLLPLFAFGATSSSVPSSSSSSLFRGKGGSEGGRAKQPVDRWKRDSILPSSKQEKSCCMPSGGRE